MRQRNIISARAMGYSKAGHNKEFGKLTEGIFSSRASAKQQELYDVLKKVGKDGISGREMEQTMGYLMKEKRKYISKNEVGKLAHALRAKRISARGYTSKGTDIFKDKKPVQTINNKSYSEPKKLLFGQNKNLAPLNQVSKINDRVKTTAPKVEFNDLSPSVRKF